MEIQTEVSGLVDPKLVGIATHRVIEKLDLGGKITPDAVRGILEKLVSRGEISGPVAEQIKIKAITRFFDSEPGKTVLKWPECVLQEWPFTFSVPAAELSEKQNDDIIIVQGIIGCQVIGRICFC